MSDGDGAKKGPSKQLCTVRIPLAKPLRDMIDKEAGAKAETVIDILEGVVPTLSPENMYGELVDALAPVIDQKAKSVVGKVMAYKRKPCRDGSSCRARGCIFLHDRDRREDGEEAGKRRRVSEEENNEVIFNKVDESRHSPEDLKAYAARFGRVVNFKRLNAEKYLVVFETVEPASELMRCSEPVLGDGGIKKFYNVIDNLVRVELKKLFEEQESVTNRMSTEFSAALLGHLRAIHARIRSLVLRERPRDGVDNKRGFDQENSLYYNCF